MSRLDDPNVPGREDVLDSLVPKIKKLLNLLRFHVVPIDGDARLLDKVEGGLGRHFQNHTEPRIHEFFGFPSAIPFEETVRCRFITDAPIAGFPSELIA